jgi:serine phosphatase RsbU (regulator of sigma subunit)
VELENENSEDFGIDKLKEILKQNPDLDMKALNKLIMETIITYKQSKPYIDDIALFSVRVH